MKKAIDTQEVDKVLNAWNLETDRRTGAKLMTRTKNGIITAIRSDDGPIAYLALIVVVQEAQSAGPLCNIM